MASERDGLRKRAKRAKDRRGLDKQTLTGMANSLRAEIHVLLTERTASMSEVSKDFGIGYDTIRNEFDRLKEVGLIEPVSERRVPGTGTVEIFYTAVKRACLDDAEWSGVPDPLKNGMRGSLLDSITTDAVGAIEAELYDSLEGAHMSRTPGLVDDEGWEELRDWLRRSLEGVIEILESSRDRLAAANVPGIPITVSMLGYPSTAPGRRVGPPPDATPRPADSDEEAPGGSARRRPRSRSKARGKRGKKS